MMTISMRAMDHEDRLACAAGEKIRLWEKRRSQKDWERSSMLPLKSKGSGGTGWVGQSLASMCMGGRSAFTPSML